MRTGKNTMGEWNTDTSKKFALFCRFVCRKKLKILVEIPKNGGKVLGRVAKGSGKIEEKWMERAGIEERRKETEEECREEMVKSILITFQQN